MSVRLVSLQFRNSIFREPRLIGVTRVTLGFGERPVSKYRHNFISGASGLCEPPAGGLS
jgi:hypothetical protein